MRYRIGFWIGPAPVDDESACADLHMHLHTAGQFVGSPTPPLPPNPRIVRFTADVLEEFPADLADPRSPWRDADAAEAAHGQTFAPVLFGPDRKVIGRLTQLAHEHGLQTFDLAAHRLLRLEDVVEWEDGPWITGPLGGSWDEPEAFACRGPEIARERLGLTPSAHVLAGTGEDSP
ncbi:MULTISPECIES: hypothetical protein [Brachybacterium]|uniref:Uncharacterized protein n=2 Tax=Brachybacterium TaxID=43668 RepID=A0A3R8QSU6_9MICO|nr:MULTISPECIES: hypothetical protein [Brachybacterium]MCT1436923.1 hypothetical protein [Brachybacterium paraconglomeratum]RRR17740.1 hypothetical protein DS079_12345 [Brachybacterium paraconglomeratum]GLI30936.1 hypothetical protein BCONGLO52_17770 [Brachybacterium conglomeratum]GLK05831.1 hypothetical protein GCM10017597_26310 [Brachybacterium conglomeratum]